MSERPADQDPAVEAEEALDQEALDRDDADAHDSGEDSADSGQTETPAVSGASDPPAVEQDKTVAEAGATEDDEPVQEMTFTQHLEELRFRLTRCVIAAFVGLLACYGYSEQLFRLLMEPLLVVLQPTGGSLIYTGVAEAFFTNLKVAGVAGLFLVSPYIFYQLWMFIAPGLYDSERKWIIPIALASAVCFVTGALFGYFVVFPFGFEFFMGYASDFIRPMPSVKEYFSFSVSMLFAFGVIFELPLIILFLASLGVVTAKWLRKFQKYAILLSFVVAAILTPPDVVSQCLMAGPLCILYEIGIWTAMIFGKKDKSSRDETQDAAQA